MSIDRALGSAVRWRGWLVAAALVPITLTAAPPVLADPALGREVYEKANCIGCHKWHGGGGGGYGGAALSLRETQLDRELLIEVTRCGRPLTRMPYHDRKAYKENECFGGETEANLGGDFPAKAAKFLRPPEVEAVVDYLMVAIQGKGAPTLEDCVAFWGETAKQCDSMR